MFSVEVTFSGLTLAVIDEGGEADKPSRVRVAMIPDTVGDHGDGHDEDHAGHHHAIHGPHTPRLSCPFVNLTNIRPETPVNVFLAADGTRYGVIDLGGKVELVDAGRPVPETPALLTPDSLDAGASDEAFEFVMDLTSLGVERLAFTDDDLAAHAELSNGGLLASRDLFRLQDGSPAPRDESDIAADDFVYKFDVTDIILKIVVGGEDLLTLQPAEGQNDLRFNISNDPISLTGNGSDHSMAHSPDDHPILAHLSFFDRFVSEGSLDFPASPAGVVLNTPGSPRCNTPKLSASLIDWS